MDLKSMEKDQIVDVVEALADGKSYALPKGYKNMGKEKLINLAGDIEKYVPEEETKGTLENLNAAEIKTVVIDFAAMSKSEIIAYVTIESQEKNIKLPSKWATYSEDKLRLLAEELKDKLKLDEDGLTVKGNTSMKQKILSCDTVNVEVPEDPISNTNYIEIGVNGVIFVYAREQSYDMPKPVAEVYKRSRQNNSKVRKRLKSFTEINS